jgi:hypothetical protein
LTKLRVLGTWEKIRFVCSVRILGGQTSSIAILAQGFKSQHYKGLDPPIPTPGGRLKRKALISRVEVFANAERK